MKIQTLMQNNGKYVNLWDMVIYIFINIKACFSYVFLFKTTHIHLKTVTCVFYKNYNTIDIFIAYILQLGTYLEWNSRDDLLQPLD